jgi:hypothetical protein
MNDNNQHRVEAAQVAPIRTWRERIGQVPDFPLHAPTDVERAMEAEIAELRARGETAEAYRLLNGVLSQFRAALAPYHFDIDEAAIAKIGELVRAHVAARSVVTRDGAKDHWRRLAAVHHPDRSGGSHAAMSELNAALAEAEKEIGS